MSLYIGKHDRLFAHFTDWPSGNRLKLDCPIGASITRVRMLGLPTQEKDNISLNSGEISMDFLERWLDF